MKISPKCRILSVSGVEIDSGLKKDRGAVGKGKRGSLPLFIGLARALKKRIEEKRKKYKNLLSELRNSSFNEKTNIHALEF